MNDLSPYKAGSITMSREMHDHVRKYLDSLKPGVYAKCPCGRWIMPGESITMFYDGIAPVPLCERCA
jgi:hypothetical protein